jgi:hypothetical protein
MLRKQFGWHEGAWQHYSCCSQLQTHINGMLYQVVRTIHQAVAVSSNGGDSHFLFENSNQ